MKIERTRIHFFSDVFSASTSSDLKVLYISKEGASSVIWWFSSRAYMTSRLTSLTFQNGGHSHR